MCKEDEMMEKVRRKINFCMFFVVLTAVLVWMFYYYGQTKSELEISEGTLIVVPDRGIQQLCR